MWEREGFVEGTPRETLKKTQGSRLAQVLLSPADSFGGSSRGNQAPSRASQASTFSGEDGDEEDEEDEVMESEGFGNGGKEDEEGFRDVFSPSFQGED